MEYVIGVDEVGMGALAGPIVICGFAAPGDWTGPPGLTDSKQLTPARRRLLRSLIMVQAVKKLVYYKIERWSHADVDRMGVAHAHRLAIRNVILDLAAKVTPSVIIVDGNLDFKGIHPLVRSYVKADSKFATVAAASVIAKVLRDQQMPGLDPEGLYDFHTNMGYPTPKHKAALKKHGPGPYHRHSYAPVREAVR